MKWTDFFLKQEQKVVDECLSTKHGYELIWIGEDLLHGSRVSPIKRQLKASFFEEQEILSQEDVVMEKFAWPFVQHSVDFIVFSHVLDLENNPEFLLKEAHRVLRMDGALLITGMSPWGWGKWLRKRQRAGKLCQLSVKQGFELKKRYFFGSRFSELKFIRQLSPGYALLLEKQTIKLRPICKEQILRASAGSVFGVEGIEVKPLPSKNQP
jgi:SAM-dependent methyltransferase